MGYQDFGQPEQRYGDSLSRTILSNCATKAWFNPQELKTAQWCSDYLGEEELNLKQKSKGQSGGKSSTNTTDNDRTRKLYSPDQFLRLSPGKCVLINPAIAGEDEVSIPITQKVKIPPAVEAEQEWARTAWNKKIKPRLIQRNPQPNLDRKELRSYTERLIEEREAEAERLLPLPGDLQASGIGKKLKDAQVKRAFQAAF